LPKVTADEKIFFSKVENEINPANIPLPKVTVEEKLYFSENKK
jgi:hypothetical protein